VSEGTDRSAYARRWHRVAVAPMDGVDGAVTGYDPRPGRRPRLVAGHLLPV